MTRREAREARLRALGYEEPDSEVRWRAYALLALALAACGPSYPDPTLTYRGVALYDAPQGVNVGGIDAAHARALLLTGRLDLLDSASVRFVGSAEGWCLLRYDVTGCYLADVDTAYVETDAVIEHELTHRARLRAGLGLDYEHADRAWWE